MSKKPTFNIEEINEPLEELESLIKDNQALLEKENVNLNSLFDIFKEIEKTKEEIQDLSKQLYKNTDKTKE